MAEYLYPLPAFYFKVSTGEQSVALFSEVSGLNMETQVIKYRYGENKQYAEMKMSGIPQSSDLVLKRGIVEKNNGFYDWLNKTQLNVPVRQTVEVTLLNDKHEPVMVWKATKAWPSKIEGPSLNSTSNEVAFESITIVYEEMAISTP